MISKEVESGIGNIDDQVCSDQWRALKARIDEELKLRKAKIVKGISQ